MNYDTVIFDLDGTLLNTLEDLADAVNVVMKANEFPQRTIEEVRCFVGNGIRRLMELAVPEHVTENSLRKCLNSSKPIIRIIVRSKPVPMTESWSF